MLLPLEDAAAALAGSVTGGRDADAFGKIGMFLLTACGRVEASGATADPSSPGLNMLNMSGVQTTSLFPVRFFFT